MTTLIAGGDSFVLGAELSDQFGSTPSQLTFSSLVSQRLGFKYQCVAVPGSSNNTITRSVLQACEEYKNKEKIVVLVMWSFMPRYEFRFAYRPSGSHWQYFNSWDAGIPEFENEYKIDLNEKISTENNLFVEFVKVFYKHVGLDTAYIWYNTLKEIVFLQNYLLVNKIPYVFTIADVPFLNNNEYNKIKETYHENLYDQIEWNNWLHLKSTANANIGFLHWAVENNYEIGINGHPLELAHLALSEKIYEHIRNLNWIS